jgi:hypothetical protein
MNHNLKKVVIEEHKRINYLGNYLLIVPDIAAGRKRRYTVYSVPSSPSRKIKVVGRELTIGQARKISEL